MPRSITCTRSRPVPRPSPPGSGGRRAASFSKYFLYSDQVVAAMVRNSPRASAGLSRLAASPWPACPAGADHGVGFVDEEDDRLRRGFDLFDQPLSRFSNSPLTPAPACSSARSRCEWLHFSTPGGRHPGQRAARSPNHSRLSHSRFAGEDGVVLPPSGSDIDHLANLSHGRGPDRSCRGERGRWIDRVLIEVRSLSAGAGSGRRRRRVLRRDR